MDNTQHNVTNLSLIAKLPDDESNFTELSSLGDEDVAYDYVKKQEGFYI